MCRVYWPNIAGYSIAPCNFSRVSRPRGRSYTKAVGHLNPTYGYNILPLVRQALIDKNLLKFGTKRGVAIALPAQWYL